MGWRGGGGGDSFDWLLVIVGLLDRLLGGNDTATQEAIRVNYCIHQEEQLPR